MSLSDRLVAELLEAGEPVAERELVRRFRTGSVSGPRIVAQLESDDRCVATDVLGRRHWEAADGVAAPGRAVTDAPASTVVGDPSDPFAGLPLRDWQVDAFAAWVGAGCRGVVEAVTGAGKTRLAMAAVRVCLSRGGRAVVIVPTLDLQEQWVGEARTHVPGARVGRLGGGHDDDLHDHDVVIATPHSAAQVPLDPPRGGPSLLVADEAHRYGAPTWGAALREVFAMRLALTATYERNDDGLVEVLGPYFGGVVHQYGYVEAARDGVIAPFRIALVGTPLEPVERTAWDEADRAAKQSRRRLVRDHHLPRHPLETVRAAVALVGAGERGERRRDDPAVAAARDYLVRLRARRDVAAQAAGKLTVLRDLAPSLQGRRTLVFCDTIDQAESAARAVVVGGGPLAETLHGDLTTERRRIRMAQFRNGNLPVLVAPRVLDEGVDVPDADIAVVLAAFRSRRQMVQRLGRVLRVKGDGRSASLVIVHAVDTLEDPDHGAHETFLDDVAAVATEVVRLDADADPDTPAAWLERT